MPSSPILLLALACALAPAAAFLDRAAGLAAGAPRRPALATADARRRGGPRSAERHSQSHGTHRDGVWLKPNEVP